MHGKLCMTCWISSGKVKYSSVSLHGARGDHVKTPYRAPRDAQQSSFKRTSKSIEFLSNQKHFHTTKLMSSARNTSRILAAPSLTQEKDESDCWSPRTDRRPVQMSADRELRLKNTSGEWSGGNSRLHLPAGKQHYSNRWNDFQRKMQERHSAASDPLQHRLWVWGRVGEGEGGWVVWCMLRERVMRVVGRGALGKNPPQRFPNEFHVDLT